MSRIEPTPTQGYTLDIKVIKNHPTDPDPTIHLRPGTNYVLQQHGSAITVLSCSDKQSPIVSWWARSIHGINQEQAGLLYSRKYGNADRTRTHYHHPDVKLYGPATLGQARAKPTRSTTTISLYANDLKDSHDDLNRTSVLTMISGTTGAVYRRFDKSPSTPWPGYSQPSKPYKYHEGWVKVKPDQVSPPVQTDYSCE